MLSGHLMVFRSAMMSQRLIRRCHLATRPQPFVETPLLSSVVESAHESRLLSDGCLINDTDVQVRVRIAGTCRDVAHAKNNLQN